MGYAGGIFVPQLTAKSVFLQADLVGVQRTPNCGYSKAVPLLLLGAWNRQHGTVLHNDQRLSSLQHGIESTKLFFTVQRASVFPENGEPLTDNYI
jgi:hypothetical protein